MFLASRLVPRCHRVRIAEAVRGTDTKKIPLSFDYCIAAQLKGAEDAPVAVESTSAAETVSSTA